MKIYYYVETQNGKSNDSLSESTAMVTLEKYGKNMYKYGFKCHWIMGKVTSNKVDGVWFLKVHVTITNMFGAKHKTIMEGKVSGTDENPNVEYFFVYD